ncbi:hypothetical protein ES288_1Z019200v1 [Gossypium darwinii]|uniref:MADS-box domain-containing protein n=1 Tax=Gossypium darwinii TaxID=34276 RepID=A0A5C7J0I9_GOSDA|nr:hypothetical protein ES288_1Z019200v1 [Gossypium darwinii]
MNFIEEEFHSKPSERLVKHSFVIFLHLLFSFDLFAIASSDKKTKGKQKIEIKIIENADDRLITFSKRRTGIYKKISELSILCGGEILFIIFSPDGKPFSFGHPSVESIAKRFSNASQHLEETIDAPVETYQICHWWKAPIDQLNLKELYEQDERFAEFNKFISITRDKKIAANASMHPSKDEDVPSSFLPRYGPNLQ